MRLDASTETVIVGTALFTVGATHLYDEHERQAGSYWNTIKAAPFSSAATAIGGALMAHMVYDWLRGKR